MREKESTRAVLPIFVAFAAHVAVAVLLLRVPSRPSPPVAAAAGTSLEEAVNLFVEVDDFHGQASPATAEAAPLPRAAGTQRSAVATPRPGPVRPEPTGEGAGAGEGEAAAPGGVGPIVLEAPRSADLGLTGTNRFLPRSEAQTEAFAQKHARDEILREKPRDRALGLGPEGPVLAALADGTARSLAPVKGSAIFVASTDASGEVVAITLDESIGERTGWAEAARLALEDLKGKKLRLPPSTKRAVMKIEIVSTLKLPSGHDPGLDVSILTIPIHKGDGKDATKLDLLNIVHAEKIAIAPGIELPFVVFSADILTLQGDPVDIGAHPRRVIHSRVLDTTTM